jgi:hypothetical protein
MQKFILKLRTLVLFLGYMPNDEEVQVTLGHIEARKAREIHCNQ